VVIPQAGGAFTVFQETVPVLDASRGVRRNEDEPYYLVEGLMIGGDAE
jgi:hypothetical protein